MVSRLNSPAVTKSKKTDQFGLRLILMWNMGLAGDDEAADPT